MNLFRHYIRGELERKGLKPAGPAVGDKPLDVQGNEVTTGTEWHDALSITLAVVMLGGMAMGVESTWHLNADVTYDVMACCGAHPLSRAIKRLLVHVC